MAERDDVVTQDLMAAGNEIKEALATARQALRDGARRAGEGGLAELSRTMESADLRIDRQLRQSPDERDVQVAALRETRGELAIASAFARRDGMSELADDLFKADEKARNDIARIETPGQITYMGEDMSEHDDRLRQSWYMPGEKVRHDPNARIVDYDTEGHHKIYGDRELTIAETAVTGLGDGRYRVDYRFEEMQGYHQAVAFDHPNRPEQDFGILMERQERLWFVPLKDLDGEAKGTAREVVGLEGRFGSAAVPQGFDEFRKEIAAEPVSGEFRMIPTEFGVPGSSAKIGAIPWMSGVSAKELETAARAVDLRLQADRGSEIEINGPYNQLAQAARASGLQIVPSTREGIRGDVQRDGETIGSLSYADKGSVLRLPSAEQVLADRITQQLGGEPRQQIAATPSMER